MSNELQPLQLLSHPVMQGLGVWWVTTRVPQLRSAESKFVVAGLVLLFIQRLRWRATVTALDNMMDWS